MDFSNENIKVYACQFTALVQRAKVQIKFPCTYFLQWKTNNGRVMVSSKNKFQANNSQILFNDTLAISVNILYDKQNKKYLKKQSLLMINLISKSRPDQIKLVGRVVIDLAEVLNSQVFSHPTNVQLEYCSIDASLSFSIKTVSSKQTTINLSELDRSSFNEYMTFQKHIVPYQQVLQSKQGSITPRDFDEIGSARGSQKGQIKSLGRDKNKFSSSSLRKQIYTSASRTILKKDQLLSQHQSKPIKLGLTPIQIQNNNSSYPAQKEIRTESQNSFSFNKDSYEENKNTFISTVPLLDLAKQPKQRFFNNKERLSQKQQIIKTPAIGAKAVDLKNSLQRDIKNSESFTIKTPQNLFASVNGESPQEKKHNKEKQQKMQITGQKKFDFNNISSQVGQNNNQTFDVFLSQQKIKLQSIQSDISFGNFPKQQSSKRFHVQIEKAHEESKRIISLTQALNQIQVKYTKLSLETEELRKCWKKEKEELLQIIQKRSAELSLKQKQIASKDYQINEINNINIILQKKCTQVQKTSALNVSELILLKSQLTKYKAQNQNILSQKQQIEEKLNVLKAQIKLVSEQSSTGKDQLNKSFAERLKSYQDKINEAEHNFLLSEKQNKVLRSAVEQLRCQNGSLISKINQLSQKDKSYSDQIHKSRNQFEKLQLEYTRLKQKQQDYQRQIKQLNEKMLQLTNAQFNQGKEQKEPKKGQKTHQNDKELIKIIQEMKASLQVAIKNQKNTLQKAEALNNIVQNLKTQISQYESKVNELNGNLLLKQSQLNQLNQTYKVSEQRNMEKIGNNQETLLTLKTQIQKDQIKIKTQQMQIQQLKLTICNKEMQHSKSLEQLDSVRAQLQVLKAQGQIYQSRFQQQHQHYQERIKSLNLSFKHEIYQQQIKFQQQLDKNQELTQVNNMLQRSLEQSQNKWAQDKIASSKSITAINDALQEKEATMLQMQSIMKSIEKDNVQFHQLLQQQKTQFQHILSKKLVKQKELKENLELQMPQFLALYQSVKNQRIKSQSIISSQQQNIVELQHKLQKQQKELFELDKTIETLKNSLQIAQQSLIQANQTNKQKVSKIQNDYSKEANRYLQKVKQLQNSILSKENELAQKGMRIFDLQQNIQFLNLQLESKNQEIQSSHLIQRRLIGQVDILEEENKKIISYNQELILSLQKKQQNNYQLSTRITQLQENLAKQSEHFEDQRSEFTTKISLLQQDRRQKEEALLLIQENLNSKLRQINQQHQRGIQEAQMTFHLAKEELSLKIQFLQQQIIAQNQFLLQKNQDIQSLTNEKQHLKQQLSSLKSQRQSLFVANLKQQIGNLKQQIKIRTEENIQLKAQANQLASLERALKIKDVEINSLKFKSSTDDKESIAEIIADLTKLKDEEIQTLRYENQKMKEIELQLYQVVSFNQSLNQDIEKYEEQKFHLNSELHEKSIRIAQLQKQGQFLRNTEVQLKCKIQQLTEKIKYYERVIMDFKGKQIFETKSQSQKMTMSRVSSAKIIHSETQNQKDFKIQAETFFRKIQLLEADLDKNKLLLQEYCQKYQQTQTNLLQCQKKLYQAEQKLQQQKQCNKKNYSNPKQINTTSKPLIQYRNPQQVVSTFKELQSLLTKRKEFYNLEKIFLNIKQQNNSKENTENSNQQHQIDKVKKLNQMIGLLGRQVQNTKSKIMKLEGKNYQEKAKFISLLRPIEDGIKQAAIFC